MSNIKNAYPELPIVECKVTSVKMNDINNCISKIPYINEVKRIVYIIVRNETGNGRSFLCNNGCGQQADGARLPAKWIPFVKATFIKKENMTGVDRRFVAFENWETTIHLLADRVFARGLYIGENVNSLYYKGNVRTVQDAATAYWQEWVVGKRTIPSERFTKDFVSMYNQSINIFK